MTARQVRIRDGVYAAILAARSGYIIPEFDLRKTYYPNIDLESLTFRPRISVVSTGFSTSRDRLLRDAESLLLEVPVQVIIQHKVNPDDLETIDEIVELAEQIMNTCEDDDLSQDPGFHYTWAATDMLKDENDLVYSYESLTVNGVFHVIFNLRYQHIKEV
jgi:hypothetical protein